MATIALVHRHYDVAHLALVTEQMRTLGAPTIKAVWLEHSACWQALEGCHRLRAAQALGLVPVIDPVEYSDDLTDINDGTATVADVCDWSHELPETLDFTDVEVL